MIALDGRYAAVSRCCPLSESDGRGVDSAENGLSTQAVWSFYRFLHFVSPKVGFNALAERSEGGNVWVGFYSRTGLRVDVFAPATDVSISEVDGDRIVGLMSLPCRFFGIFPMPLHQGVLGLRVLERRVLEQTILKRITSN